MVARKNGTSDEGLLPVWLYGTSGQAMFVYEQLVRSPHPLKIMGFLETLNSTDVEPQTGLPVLSVEEWAEAAGLRDQLLLTPGTPKVRRRVSEALSGYDPTYLCGGFDPMTLASWKKIAIGEGTYIGQYSLVGNNVVIGRHVQVMTFTNIGHDVEIGDFVTLAPGAIVSGYVRIEEAVFVGAGAIITNGTKDRPIIIGRESILAAGSVTNKSVPVKSHIIGVPGEPIRSFIKRRHL